MSDNTDNLSSNTSLLNTSTAHNIEQFATCADGTDRENRDNRENRENTINRETHVNRVNLIELKSSEEQDFREKNKVVNSVIEMHRTPPSVKRQAPTAPEN